jgi:hypothetical protein
MKVMIVYLQKWMNYDRPRFWIPGFECTLNNIAETNAPDGQLDCGARRTGNWQLM